MKSSKSIKSKQLLLSGLVALVLIAGYYRWTLDAEKSVVPVMSDAVPENTQIEEIEKIEKIEMVNPDTTEYEEQLSYFEKSKYDRDLKRSQTVSSLQEIVDSEEEEEKKEETRKEISDAAKRAEKESVIENLIISKGFENCVVFMEDDSVSIVVKADTLDEKKVNQIKDIVLSKTEYKAHQLVISSKTE